MSGPMSPRWANLSHFCMIAPQVLGSRPSRAPPTSGQSGNSPFSRWSATRRAVYMCVKNPGIQPSLLFGYAPKPMEPVSYWLKISHIDGDPPVLDEIVQEQVGECELVHTGKIS